VTWVGLARNACAAALVELGMALARLGDHLYDCKPTPQRQAWAYSDPRHDASKCWVCTKSREYRKGDC
jgi:hypothetical protein